MTSPLSSLVFRSRNVEVEEGNLTQQVFLLRKALGETAQQPRYIVTIPVTATGSRRACMRSQTSLTLCRLPMARSRRQPLPAVA